MNMSDISRYRLLLPLLVVCLFWMLSPRLASAQSLENLTYLTEEYYPFNYTESDKIKGFSADILRLVWDRLGVPRQKIESMPWARAYDRVQIEPATVLFSMARTPEREAMFRWAGPILTVRFVLIAKKEKHITITDLTQLAGFSIGTMREDISDTILAPYGSKNTIEALADMRQNVKKLREDRLDMIAYEEKSWPHMLARIGLDPNDFETILVLKETPIYYAFHRNTPLEMIARFQQALDAIKDSAAYDNLLNKYLM